MKSYREILKNKIIKTSIYDKLNVALLSDQSTQFLSKVIHGLGIENSLSISVWEAPINQIEQQIYNPGSKFNSESFDSILIFESTHSLLKKFSLTQEKNDFAEIQIDRIKAYLNHIRDTSNKKVILFNFYELNDYVYGNFSSKVDQSFIFQLRKLNFLISEFILNNDKISILDISTIQNKIGFDKMLDASMYINYGFILSLDSLPPIAKNIIDLLLVHKSIFKKCLVLDLDNTLWGGIIGDDGIDKIQLGELGIGKAFVDFQTWIMKLKERGIIICICSKNSEDVAKNVFINHPDMKLTLDDVSVFVANWDSKVDNIKNIQKVLNIGFDSMVFLDDNPYERDSVRNNIPDITVPDLPLDPANYLSFLYQENLFETISVSDLDKNRTNLYQTEYERVKLKSNFTDLAEYMLGLNMLSRVDKLSTFNIPRVSQLSHRSNQFNLRTVRYSENDLAQIMKSEDDIGFVFDLKDKFGSHGIISLIILKKVSESDVFIENWAMSCRVLERGMEQFIINYLIEYCQQNEILTISSEYLETKKNKIVSTLYNRLGFTQNKNKYYLKVGEQPNLETKISINNE
jgi:FkbH-like protein